MHFYLTLGILLTDIDQQYLYAHSWALGISGLNFTNYP